MHGPGCKSRERRKNMNILGRLWEIKEDRNYTDKQLESFLGVDRMTIYRWRKREKKPSPLAEEKIKMFVEKEGKCKSK
mgnify:CR=1 FL=1